MSDYLKVYKVTFARARFFFYFIFFVTLCNSLFVNEESEKQCIFVNEHDVKNLVFLFANCKNLDIASYICIHARIQEREKR